MRIVMLALVGWLGVISVVRAETREAMLAARQASQVVVTFVMADEMQREERRAIGMVIDAEGRIVLPPETIPSWLPVNRLEELRVFLPDSVGEGFSARYLGRNPRTTLQFVQVDDAELRTRLVPCTQWPVAEPRVGESYWGIGISGENLDYLPYWLEARLSSRLQMPRWYGFATGNVASEGGMVFAGDGAWVGWALPGYGEPYLLMIEGKTYQAQLRPLEESNTFLLASELKPLLADVPTTPDAEGFTWLGVTNLQPLDKDTARFLGLEGQGAVIVSEVIAGQPADQAGLKARDIITTIDGATIPYYRFAPAMVRHLNQAIADHRPGETLRLGVIRGTTATDISVTLGQGPKLAREVERTYFSELGLTVRELVLDDAVARRVTWADAKGAVVSFVRPNSSPDTAGLEPGDWITEINGQPTPTYTEAVAALEAIKADTTAPEYVLLVLRGNETALVRVPRGGR